MFAKHWASSSLRSEIVQDLKTLEPFPKTLKPRLGDRIVKAAFREQGISIMGAFLGECTPREQTIGQALQALWTASRGTISSLPQHTL
jgi:hypothetical protein